MQIELFINELGIVGSFRHSRANNCFHKPKLENIYNINKIDFKKLIIALDHTAILGTSKNYDFNSGNLYLKIIDNAGYYYKKGKFLENI